MTKVFAFPRKEEDPNAWLMVFKYLYVFTVIMLYVYVLSIHSFIHTAMYQVLYQALEI